MSRTGKDTSHPEARAPRSEDAEWLTTAEAAYLLGCAPQTLNRKRHEGNGPPFRRPVAGGRKMVRYRRAELVEWMGEQRYTNSATVPPTP